jgi:hypothetical protein
VPALISETDRGVRGAGELCHVRVAVCSALRAVGFDPSFEGVSRAAGQKRKLADLPDFPESGRITFDLSGPP